MSNATAFENKCIAWDKAKHELAVPVTAIEQQIFAAETQGAPAEVIAKLEADLKVAEATLEAHLASAP